MARQWERLVVNWLGLERTSYVAECSSQSSLSRTLVVLWLPRSDLPGSGLAPKLAGQWSMMGEHGLGVICHDRSVSLTCICPLSVALCILPVCILHIRFEDAGHGRNFSS